MAQYHHLKKNCIRLLSVHRDDRDSAIVGEFKTVSLQDEDSHRYRRIGKKLDYFAVSYVWGSFEGYRTIQVDGNPLEITPNAFNVLNLFCDANPKDKKVWLWIDAVCINQKDVVEKNVQVPLMAWIYSRAKRGIVWLGEGNPLSDMGMELMHMLAMGKNGYPVPQSVYHNPDSWAGFRDIASRPWWRRAWTLQESVIPSDLVYYCGDRCLPAEDVRNAVLVASSYNYTEAGSPLEKAILAPLWHRRRIFQWLGHQDMDDEFDGYSRRRHTGEPKLGQISLLALLAYQRHALASDPKDYIYSLLGCIKDKDKQLVGPPNYDGGIEEIYSNFVKRWVLAYGSLDIIAFSQLFRQTSLSQDSITPSWVPDWSARLEPLSEESNAVPLLVSQPVNSDVGSMLPPRFLRGEARSREYRGNHDKPPEYAAAGEMALRVSFSPSMKSVVCTGMQLGNIDGLSGSTGNYHLTALVQSTSPANVDTTKSLDHNLVACDIMLSLYFGRADVYLQYQAEDKEILAEALEALTSTDNQDTEAFRAWVDANAALSIRGMTLKDALTKAEPADLPNDDAAEERPRSRSYTPSNISDDNKGPPEDEEAAKHSLSRKFRYATHPHWMARRLAVTQEGCVGMAPRDAIKGDVVCILYGCSVPMLLRPVPGGQYLVVGECYLQGFMEGQALDAEYEMCDFTLV